MSNIISANSEEFLKPLYDHLESGKSLALRYLYSRVGGGADESLLKTVDELITQRASNRCWRTQCIIQVCFHPQIIWDGRLTMEVFQKMWKAGCRKSYEVLLFEPNCLWGKYYEEDLYGWVCEFLGKNVIVVKEMKYKDAEALVPMPDGTLELGAY